MNVILVIKSFANYYGFLNSISSYFVSKKDEENQKLTLIVKESTQIEVNILPEDKIPKKRNNGVKLTN